MATNGHSGYPLKWFKDQNTARHAFECAICLEVLKDAVQVRNCGHQFCALCVDDILKVDPRCPSCRIEISDVMVHVFEDHAARRLIKQLEVNCCNEDCGWQGSLSCFLQDHQDNCNFLIRSGNNVHHLDVSKLEEKLEVLMLKVSTLERKEKKLEEDIEELKLKHKEDVRVLRQEILLSQARTVPQAVPHPSPIRKPEPDYTWKIANFAKKLAAAKACNDYGDIASEPFFSSHGYKMKLSAYLNEGPNGMAGYMGIYIHLMKSDRDGTLPWPFSKRYTFVLVDQQDDLSQRQNIVYSGVPEGEKNFKKPTQRENEGRGNPQFVKHSTLRTRQYIRDCAVYIKVLIDP